MKKRLNKEKCDATFDKLIDEITKHNMRLITPIEINESNNKLNYDILFEEQYILDDDSKKAFFNFLKNV